MCIVSYLIGLLFVTGSGEYWVKIFDSFAGTTGLIFIALLESVAVMYIYGHRKYVYRDNLPRPFGHDLEIYLGAHRAQ